MFLFQSIYNFNFILVSMRRYSILCCFKFYFSANLELEMMHSKGYFMNVFIRDPVYSNQIFGNMSIHKCYIWKIFFPSWTDAMWYFKVSFCVNWASHMLHLKDVSPSWTDAIYLQIPFFCKLSITSTAFKGLFSLMDWCNMSNQFLFFYKLGIGYGAFKGLLSLMNWCNMSIQLPFSGICKSTDATFKRLFSFMDWCKMNIQIWLLCKLGITYVAFKGFLSLIWIDLMCLFNVCFSVNLALHILHSKGFIPSWMDAMWVFKLLFCANLASHMLHSKSFFPSWTDAIWPFKFDFCANLVLHTYAAFIGLLPFMNWCNVSV